MISRKYHHKYYDKYYDKYHDKYYDKYYDKYDRFWKNEMGLSVCRKATAGWLGDFKAICPIEQLPGLDG